MLVKTMAIRALFSSVVMAAPLAGLTGIANAQASSKGAAYSQVLQQISDARLEVIRKEYFVETQKAEMAALRGEIRGVGATTANVDGIIAKMVSQTEAAILTDLPFLREKRLNRIERLKEALADPTQTPGGRYRLALNALKIEVNYGSSVESYDGERPLNNGEEPVIVAQLDGKGELVLENDGGEMLGAEKGTFLRYGRVALIYMNQRATSARRYDVPSTSWVDMSAADLLDVRKAVRIAKGEAAPAVLMVPAYIAE